MEHSQQAQTFRFPPYFDLSLMNQAHFQDVHFSPIYLKGFLYLFQYKKINSLQMEEEPKNPSFQFNTFRRSITQKRTYHKKNKSLNHNHGRWTQEEENLYLQFVSEFALKNPNWLEKVSGQKRILYFKAMSDFIVTRSPEQCRSKDQKMQERYPLSQGRSIARQNHQSSFSSQQNVEVGRDQREFDHQERSSSLEKIFERRSDTEFSSSLFESSHASIQNVDIFFNFSSNENVDARFEHDFGHQMNN